MLFRALQLRDRAPWFFIGRQVNHAIGNHYIDRVVGQGDTLYFAFKEFNILHPSSMLIFTRQSEHCIGHVEAIGFPRLDQAGALTFSCQRNVSVPRSRTISPGRSSASALGLSLPKDALKASSGLDLSHSHLIRSFISQWR